MAHSHAEVPSLPRPQCGASFTAEIGLIVDEDKLREAPAAAVPPAVAEVLGTSVQEVNSELTGRAGAELVTLEATMAVAAVGAGIVDLAIRDHARGQGAARAGASDGGRPRGDCFMVPPPGQA